MEQEFEVTPELVGARVQVAGRGDWGIGTVLKISPTTQNGAAAQRVEIQFGLGVKQLVVPPARLIEPGVEPQREAGWLASLGRNSLDDKLRSLPEENVQVLGGPAARLAAVFPLYEFGDDPTSLMNWARKQTQVGDPLSQWSRDELQVAFRQYCNERDAHLRAMAAVVKQSAGAETLDSTLSGLEPEIKARVIEALRRPI